jgi:hypothetical protein
MYRAICSPDDVATYRRWRRGVFMFYGAIGLILVAASGVHHLWERGDAAQIAGTARPAPVLEAGHGERVP